MIDKIKIAVFAWVLSASCYAQQSYEEIDKAKVSVLIADYLANNIKNKEFGLKIDIEHDNVSFTGHGITENNYEIILLGSKKLKSKLLVWRGTYFSADNFSTVDWHGLLTRDKRYQFIAGKSSSELVEGKGFNTEDGNDALHGRTFLRTDPMLLPITNKRRLLSSGGPPTDYWKLILDENNLLSAQANERYTRAEFRGKGVDSKSRFQIYFDKQQAGLPSIGKFFITRNPEKPFSTDFELSFYETFTQWEGDPDKGFRPAKIQMRQEERVTATKKLIGMEEVNLELNWKFSGLANKESLDSNWFDPDIIDGEWDQLAKRFDE